MSLEKCGELREAANGMVIVRSGNLSPLSRPQDNHFVFEQDPIILNETTNKPLYSLQKPVQFLASIINLYSIQGDWILDGHCGTGTYAGGIWLVIPSPL